MCTPAGKPIASTLRQKHFDKPANLAAAHFSSEHVYTFVIGQSILDMMQYRLSLGGLLNLDLCPILNGQPLQMMCKNIRVRRGLCYCCGLIGDLIRRVSCMQAAAPATALVGMCVYVVLVTVQAIAWAAHAQCIKPGGESSCKLCCHPSHSSFTGPVAV